MKCFNVFVKRYIFVVLLFFLFSMSVHANFDIELLFRKSSTDDEIFLKVQKKTQEFLNQTIAQKASNFSIENVKILILNFDKLKNQGFNINTVFTENCTPRFFNKKNFILCNVEFLREAEIVIRGFEDGTVIYRDVKMFDFIKTVLSKRKENKYITYLRHEDTIEKKSHIEMHLTLFMYFVISHELGHIVNGDQENNYQMLPLKKAPKGLEKTEIFKTINICRHAKDINQEGIQFDAIFSDPTQNEKLLNEYTNKFPVEQKIIEEYFINETKADEFAEKVMVSYYDKQFKIDYYQGVEKLHIFLQSMFAYGLYQWFLDLYKFSINQCYIEPDNIKNIYFCLISQQKKYLDSAQIFGETHRFILLRVISLFKVLLNEKTDVLKSPQKYLFSINDLMKLSKKEQSFMIWMSGNLQKYMILSAVTDAAVKLSAVGCGYAWRKSVGGGTRILMVDLYSLEDEMARLFKLRAKSDYHNLFEYLVSVVEGKDIEFDNDSPISVGKIKEQIELNGTTLNSDIKLSCNFSRYSKYRKNEERMACVDNLIREFFFFLEGAGYYSELIVDSSEVGWVRKIYTVVPIESNKSNSFSFYINKEVNMVGSMGYLHLYIGKISTSEKK